MQPLPHGVRDLLRDRNDVQELRGVRVESRESRVQGSRFRVQSAQKRQGAKLQIQRRGLIRAAIFDHTLHTSFRGGYTTGPCFTSRWPLPLVLVGNV